MPPRPRSSAARRRRIEAADSVTTPVTPEQKKSNQRLGLILGAVAVAVFVGFIFTGAFGRL